MNNELNQQNVEQFIFSQQSLQSQSQDQLLAQNATLIQQLQEQQRLLNLRNIFTNNLLLNPFLQNQINQDSKMIKKSKSTLKTIASTVSLREQAQPIQDIKGNVKNAYIKKITSLLSVEGDKLIDEDIQDDLDGESSDEIIVKNKFSGLLGSTNDLMNAESKNKKLKHSAKKSRLRKKVYQKLLERKVQELDSQIEQYKKTTRQSFDYLSSLLTSHPILNSMIIGNSNAIDKLQQSKNNADSVSMIVDSYLMRYGTSGIKRRDYIHYALKNIQRNFLKGNYPLQLIGWNPSIKQDDQEFNQYVEAIKQHAELEDENLIYKVLPTIHRVQNHRKNSQKYYHNKIRLLYKLNEDIYNFKQVQRDVEENITTIVQSLNPSQHLELIKSVEKLGNFNRFRI